MGGILIITLDYFAKKKNSKVCAFIPAVPVISLIGLYFICAHNGNIKEYVYNLVLYLSISVMFYLLFYILLHYNTIYGFYYIIYLLEYQIAI